MLVTNAYLSELIDQCYFCTFLLDFTNKIISRYNINCPNLNSPSLTDTLHTLLTFVLIYEIQPCKKNFSKVFDMYKVVGEDLDEKLVDEFQSSKKHKMEERWLIITKRLNLIS